jgi:hypothetical protein
MAKFTHHQHHHYHLVVNVSRRSSIPIDNACPVVIIQLRFVRFALAQMIIDMDLDSL